MPELRFDYTTADWVVFAPLRKLRPHSNEIASPTVQHAAITRDASCPFCPGNEAMNPIEADRIEADDGSGNWSVRAIPNKFPALEKDETEQRIHEGPVFQKMGGCGAHEVIIESPDHELTMARQPLSQVAAVVQMLHRRYCDLMKDDRFQSVVVFKNHGERAGTSLRHPHWQIIATPVVPRMLRLQYTEAAEYYHRSGRSLYEVLIEEELRCEQRMLCVNEEFVAFMPYASHQAFETWIMPRRLQASFGFLVREQIEPLADILKTALLKLYVGLQDPDFNLTVDTVSRREEDHPGFRWHIRILPRLATTAGFELGSGMSINSVLPEDAASFLRGGNAGPGHGRS